MENCNFMLFYTQYYSARNNKWYYISIFYSKLNVTNKRLFEHTISNKYLNK